MLIYDGDCGFCTSSAMWIASRLPAEVEVVPWQSLDLDDYGLSETDVDTAAYWVDGDGGTHRGHLAIGHSLTKASGPLALLGRAIVTPPVSWIASPVYALIAKYRYRMPGSTDACRLPAG